jgi:hypothetical protein
VALFTIMRLSRPKIAKSVTTFTALAILVSFAKAEEAVRPARPIALFNGRDLAGWSHWLVDAKGNDPRGVFSVKDGEIHISGDGLGYLKTKERYRDYRLIVEFRWGERNHGERKEKARDSGIFMHAVGPDGNSYDGRGAYMAAIECQVMQGAVGDLLLIKGRDKEGRDVPVKLSARVAEKRDADGWPFRSPEGRPTTMTRTGRLNWLTKDRAWTDALDFRGRRDVESPRDEWTRIECIARGNRITVKVNDRLVNEAHDVFPAAGHILLQCEGSEVYFRKVELRPLDD